MTPELRPVWCAATRCSLSSTVTPYPRPVSSCAVASPTIPAPITTTCSALIAASAGAGTGGLVHSRVRVWHRTPPRRCRSLHPLTKVRGMSSTVATVRQFNRAWTQRVGALDESFLGSGRPLGPSRLLFEIGSMPGGAVVRELRDRLGLDSGYLSRLLRRLEDEGLVTTGADPDDARRRVVRLAAAGRTAWAELEQRSDQLARDLV